MTLLTSFVTRWPDSGLTAVATFDWATVARSVTPVDVTTLVTASSTASLTASIALAASRPNLGLVSGVAESGLLESCLLSGGFADCDVLVPPSPSDSVWAEAVPAPSSIPTVTPAHTAPAPSQSKNRSPMPSPVCGPPVTLTVDASVKSVFTKIPPGRHT